MPTLINTNVGDESQHSNQHSNQHTSNTVATHNKNDNNDNNNILYLFNKYKRESKKDFYSKMRWLHEIENDEKFQQLSNEAVDELRVKVLGDV